MQDIKTMEMGISRPDLKREYELTKHVSLLADHSAQRLFQLRAHGNLHIYHARRKALRHGWTGVHYFPENEIQLLSPFPVLRVHTPALTAISLCRRVPSELAQTPVRRTRARAPTIRGSMIITERCNRCHQFRAGR